jgi:hypothetical protein
MKAASSSGGFATVLQAFFLERLVAQRNASPQTVAAYRDSFRLLLQFAHQHAGKAPERLDLKDVDAPLVLAFLDHLERERQNTIRSRNARLAAIRSFMHFAAFKDPAALPGIQRVLAIPMKRFDKPLLGSCSPRCITPVPGSPSSPAFVSAMSSWREAPASTSMAKDARTEASPCGGPPRHGCDSGYRGLIAGPTGRSFPARRADV